MNNDAYGGQQLRHRGAPVPAADPAGWDMGHTTGLCRSELYLPADHGVELRPGADPTPAVAPDSDSQFNYPAYTIENTVNVGTTCRLDQ